MRQIRFYAYVNQKFRKKPAQFSNESNNKNSYIVGIFIVAFEFPIDIFFPLLEWNLPYKCNRACSEIVRLRHTCVTLHTVFNIYS